MHTQQHLALVDKIESALNDWPRIESQETQSQWDFEHRQQLADRLACLHSSIVQRVAGMAEELIKMHQELIIPIYQQNRELSTVPADDLEYAKLGAQAIRVFTDWLANVAGLQASKDAQSYFHLALGEVPANAAPTLWVFTHTPLTAVDPDVERKVVFYSMIIPDTPQEVIFKPLLTHREKDLRYMRMVAEKMVQKEGLNLTLTKYSAAETKREEAASAPLLYAFMEKAPGIDRRQKVVAYLNPGEPLCRPLMCFGEKTLELVAERAREIESLTGEPLVLYIFTKAEVIETFSPEPSSSNKNPSAHDLP